MKILALESSTNLASVALQIDGKIVASESSMKLRSHSEFINVAIENCLQKAQISLKDIDFYASGLGPGSFTGIRVAGNAAKSFAYSFQKKMVVCDSLTLLASQVENETKPVLAILNAYKNMVYFALYKNKICIEKPSACFVKDLASILKKHSTKGEVLCLGDGYNAYQSIFDSELLSLLQRNSSYADFPTAEMLCQQATQMISQGQTIEWNSYLPLYIRASEAEENLRLR